MFAVYAGSPDLHSLSSRGAHTILLRNVGIIGSVRKSGHTGVVHKFPDAKQGTQTFFDSEEHKGHLFVHCSQYAVSGPKHEAARLLHLAFFDDKPEARKSL